MIEEIGQQIASMMDDSSYGLLPFTASTRAAFQQRLRENPANRRISKLDKDIVVEWLTDPCKRPSSQKEFSRRNYILKTFTWDERTQSLLAVGKAKGENGRIVVTEDAIVDVVDSVHQSNNHGGWDATWKDINSSYHGILRSDVIFLLKQCQVCASNPSKRPKGSAAMERGLQPI